MRKKIEENRAAYVHFALFFLCLLLPLYASFLPLFLPLLSLCVLTPDSSPNFRFEIPKDEWEAIELPLPKPEENALVLLDEKRQELTTLLSELHDVRTRLAELKKETLAAQEAKRVRQE